MKPYRFSFVCTNDRGETGRLYQLHIAKDMETALANAKATALLSHPDAHAFAIESDQEDLEIRKSWGLS